MIVMTAALLATASTAFAQAAPDTAGARGTPPADEAQRKRWIENIDVAGNAGIAKVILDYPTTTRFVDYLSLLKIDGEWKIINNTFYAEAKKE